VFGVIWTILAIAVTGSAPDIGPFSVVKIVFPLFGVAFTIAGIAYGLYCYSRAQKYQQAYAAYLARKKQLRPGH
jgi:hypothetical protein